jgi:hypothetical protein
VRTRSSHNYELIVRPDDNDDDIYVLVTGKCPTYRIRGYIYGDRAKMPEYMQTHGNRPAAFFVPHSKLLGIEDLRNSR